MKKILFALIAFTIAATACTKANDKKVLKVGTDATWPPMEFIKDQQIVGFDIDFINAVAREGGFEVKIVNAAWDGIFASLDAGEFDMVISSVTISDERKKTMDFSTPYLNAGQIMVVRKDTEAKTLADFAGKQAGAQIGTTGAAEIKKNSAVKLKTYDEIGLAIADLANGRVDVVVTDTPTAANFVLQNEKYKSSLKLAGTPFTSEFYGIAVKKGNKEVLDLVNKGIEKLLVSGEIKKLEEKWLR